MRCLVPIAAALALSACATDAASCDPAQADFFSGISCQNSGAYAVRNNQLNSNLAAARYNLQVERSRADAASVDASQAQAERNRTAGALAGMRQQNASLRSRLDAASRRQGADQTAIARQRNQLDRLEQDRAAAQRDGASQADLRALEQRRQAILDAVGSL